MTVSIDTPKSWIEAELTELKHAISSIDQATENQSDLVFSMENMGAMDTANELRMSLAKGNHARLNDMRKTFSYRVRTEQPDPVILWPGSNKESIRERIQAMTMHEYDVDAISEQYAALNDASD